MADVESKEIIALFQGKGSEHDFSMYKRSGMMLCELLVLLADSGFQGIESLHRSSWIPHKKSKRNPLSAERKRDNRVLASIRICIEHIIRRIKRFKILSDRYRNKRKRHSLRMSLICGIYNFGLC